MINRESIHHHQNETSKTEPDRNVDSCSVRLMVQRELGVWRHTFSVCEQESRSARILFTTRCASRRVASVCFGSVRTQGNCGISHVTSLLSRTFNGSLNQQTFTSYTGKNNEFKLIRSESQRFTIRAWCQIRADWEKESERKKCIVSKSKIYW